MIVIIDSGVYQNDEHFDDLDNIINLFTSGKHFWYISEPSEVENSQWLISEGNSRLKKRVDILLKSAVKGAYVSKCSR